MASSTPKPTMPPPDGDRLSLRSLIKATGKTQGQIAEEVGVDPTYISQMVNGRVNWVNSAYFPALVSALGLNFRQVETLRPDAVTGLARAAGLLAASDGVVKIAPGGWVDVEVYGMATANPDGPTGSVTAPVGTARVPQQYVRENTHAYLVLGDSMDDGTIDGIRDGDTVMCDHSDLDLREGRIYVVKVMGNGILLKRVRLYADGERALTSDNLNYRPISPDDAIIIGRVIWHAPQGRPK